MNEWGKILISTAVGSVAGFASALLLEPVKVRFNFWLTSRRAEREINREIGRMYFLFCLRNDEAPELAYKAAFDQTLTDVYDYYFDHHREAIYRMKNYERFHGFYIMYQLIRGFYIKKECTASDAARRMRREFEFRFSSGLLYAKTIKKHGEGFLESDNALMDYHPEIDRGANAASATEYPL